MKLPSMSETYAASRADLHLVAAHIVARSRFQATGRFGLRPLPGGFGTPAFGSDAEVVRVSDGRLIRERTGQPASTVSAMIDGRTLRELAGVAGVDLDRPFDAGEDLPGLGDTDRRLSVDASSAKLIGQWIAFSCPIIDRVVGETSRRIGDDATPGVLQHWPEHFDAGLDIGVAPGRRMNLGASLGDGYHRAPYLYAGPWTPDRPGDAGYWNAPFGAVLGYEELAVAPDPGATAEAFLTEGIARLSGA